MNLGAQKLLQRIVDTHSSYRRAGQELGISFTQVCRLAKGKRKPTLEQAHDIAKWSEGEIKTGDWLKEEKSNES